MAYVGTVAMALLFFSEENIEVVFSETPGKTRNRQIWLQENEKIVTPFLSLLDIVSCKRI